MTTGTESLKNKPKFKNGSRGSHLINADYILIITRDEIRYLSEVIRVKRF